MKNHSKASANSTTGLMNYSQLGQKKNQEGGSWVKKSTLCSRSQLLIISNYGKWYCLRNTFASTNYKKKKFAVFYIITYVILVKLHRNCQKNVFQPVFKVFDIFKAAAKLRFNLRLCKSVLTEVLLTITLGIITLAITGNGGCFFYPKILLLYGVKKNISQI